MTNWWNKKWGKDQICGITHNRLKCGVNKNGIPFTSELNCKHRFQTNALLEWMKINSTCPLCREPFNLESLLRYIYNYFNKNKVSDNSKPYLRSKKCPDFYKNNNNLL